jgi:peroxiredoxin
VRFESDRLHIGDPAPWFELESATGGTLDLKTLAGSPLALMFFRGTW